MLRERPYVTTNFNLITITSGRTGNGGRGGNGASIDDPDYPQVYRNGAGEYGGDAGTRKFNYVYEYVGYSLQGYVFGSHWSGVISQGALGDGGDGGDAGSGTGLPQGGGDGGDGGTAGDVWVSSGNSELVINLPQEAGAGGAAGSGDPPGVSGEDGVPGSIVYI
jgi:hypothetical protein